RSERIARREWRCVIVRAAGIVALQVALAIDANVGSELERVPAVYPGGVGANLVCLLRLCDRPAAAQRVHALNGEVRQVAKTRRDLALQAGRKTERGEIGTQGRRDAVVIELDQAVAGV